MRRPIHPGLSPNLEKEDAAVALGNLIKVFSWRKGKYILALEQWFERYFKGYEAISFVSGRGALFAILHSLGIKKGDEVILQAFTCAAVPQAIIAAGANPIYVDIDDSLTMDIEEVVKKITTKTKAILFQYTFGNPGNIEKVKAIAKERNIFLIEDAAHVLGVSYKNKKLGAIGDASIFSFGRDKAFSSVSGGIALTKDKMLAKKIKEFQKRQQFPTYFYVFQQLFHEVMMLYFILRLYDVFNSGKGILVILQKLHLLSKPVSTHFDKSFALEIKKMPNVLSQLALMQVKKLERFNKKRIKIVKEYQEITEVSGWNKIFLSESAYLRFPILTADPKKMKKFFRKKGIYLGDWYSNCIDPRGTDLSTLLYATGMCPQAEETAKHILNLPTYPTMSEKDVQKVIKTMKQWDTRAMKQ